MTTEDHPVIIRLNGNRWINLSQLILLERTDRGRTGCPTTVKAHFTGGLVIALTPEEAVTTVSALERLQGLA